MSDVRCACGGLLEVRWIPTLEGGTETWWCRAENQPA